MLNPTRLRYGVSPPVIVVIVTEDPRRGPAQRHAARGAREKDPEQEGAGDSHSEEDNDMSVATFGLAPVA